MLIDDDPVYGAIIQKLAGLGGIQLTYVRLVRDWDWKTYPLFDVVVVDYDLSTMSGVQLVRSLEKLYRPVPTLLISNYKQIPVDSGFPGENFISKTVGPQRILFAALKAAEEKPKNILCAAG